MELAPHNYLIYGVFREILTEKSLKQNFNSVYPKLECFPVYKNML